MIRYVRFQFLTAARLKKTAFWKKETYSIIEKTEVSEVRNASIIRAKNKPRLTKPNKNLT
jgi:hypothetical protein